MSMLNVRPQDREGCEAVVQGRMAPLTTCTTFTSLITNRAAATPIPETAALATDGLIKLSRWCMLSKHQAISEIPRHNLMTLLVKSVRKHHSSVCSIMRGPLLLSKNVPSALVWRVEPDA